MVSLVKLSEVTEDGVKFQSPHNQTEMLLTPEKSIEIQNAIGSKIYSLFYSIEFFKIKILLGADIIMQLDDVVSSTITGPRVEQAMWRLLIFRFLFLFSFINNLDHYDGLIDVYQHIVVQMSKVFFQLYKVVLILNYVN